MPSKGLKTSDKSHFLCLRRKKIDNQENYKFIKY